METINIILIVLGCTLVLAVIYYWNFENTQAQKERHIEYCNNWGTNLGHRILQLNNTRSANDIDEAHYLAESDQYRKECVF